MDFTTFPFWLIMLPAMCFMYCISHFIKTEQMRHTIGKLGLCILSLTLLYTASPNTLLIFLTVTILAYAGCRYMYKHGQRSKNILLAFLIFLLLLPLAYYKYAHFVTKDILNLPWDTFRDLIIPIGISFYTFQTIAFCIDTLKRNQKLPHFLDYMNFCSFFPQIVAGPIERKDSLLPQMEVIQWKWNADTLARGIPYIFLGLFFKMVLADNLATAMQIGYRGDNALQVWANNIAFGFRIYFDFAGYGLTAYGIAKSLGVNITLNFLSPYTCSNVTDFWRKWHISLTQWFRDYIYFALGGSRTRLWWFNIIFMFLVSGIWHGAGWNFIIWGGLAGITMVIHRAFRQFNKPLPGFIGWCITIAVMMFIWMFFYETDMSIVWKNVCTVFDISSYNAPEFIQMLKENAIAGSHLVLFSAMSFLIIFLEYLSSRRYANPYQIFLSPAACSVMVLLMCLLHSQQQSQFIYFAF